MSREPTVPSVAGAGSGAGTGQSVSGSSSEDNTGTSQYRFIVIINSKQYNAYLSIIDQNQILSYIVLGS